MLKGINFGYVWRKVGVAWFVRSSIGFREVGWG